MQLNPLVNLQSNKRPFDALFLSATCGVVYIYFRTAETKVKWPITVNPQYMVV